MKLLSRGRTLRDGVNSWNETAEWKPDGDGRAFTLAHGRRLHVVIVAYDCEIDKESRVLIAPVGPMSEVKPEKQDFVRRGERYPFVPLEAIDGGVLEESYADLRLITHVDRKLIDACTKVRSMDAAGVEQLQAQIIAYFSRIAIGDLRRS